MVDDQDAASEMSFIITYLILAGQPILLDVLWLVWSSFLSTSETTLWLPAWSQAYIAVWVGNNCAVLTFIKGIFSLWVWALRDLFFHPAWRLICKSLLLIVECKLHSWFRIVEKESLNIQIMKSVAHFLGKGWRGFPIFEAFYKKWLRKSILSPFWTLNFEVIFILFFDLFPFY